MGNFVARSRYRTSRGRSIGFGLFTDRDRVVGERFAIFCGVVIEATEYRALRHAHSPQARYCVEFEDELSILNCYHSYLRGDCLASYVNSPWNLREDVAQRAVLGSASFPARRQPIEANAAMVGGAPSELDPHGYAVWYETIEPMVAGDEYLALYTTDGTLFSPR